MRVMTPEYAAPEQLRGESVTTSSDVYSLGVLLYELLTGVRPYRSEEGDADSRAVQRRLRGDLDRITLTALQKSPERRYPSAEALAADIQRHLDGLPITTRGEAMKWRARLFCRHHRIAVRAAALALVALAGLVAARWVARQAPAAPARDAIARTAASLTPRKSVAVLEFQNLSGRSEHAWLATAIAEMLTTELAASGKLHLIPGEDVARMVRELRLRPGTLSRDAAARAANNLKVETLVAGSYTVVGSPGSRRVRLDLRLQGTATGEILAEVAETGAEQQLLDLISAAGARLRERLGVPDHSPTDQAGIKASVPANPEAARLYAVGLARLRVLDAVAARDLLQHAVAADPWFPLSRLALASAWRALGYGERARAEAKMALDRSGRLPRAEQLLVAGSYYLAANELDNAIAAYRSLFALFPDSLEYGLMLADAQTRSGKAAQALATLDALRRLPRPLSADARIDLQHAGVLVGSDDYRGALIHARRARDQAKASEAVLLVASAEATACWALKSLGQPDDATAACQTAWQIYAESGDRSGEARMMRLLGDIEWSQGKLSRALALYRQALSVDEMTGQKAQTASTLNEMGLVYESRGMLADAERFYRRSYRLFVELGNRRNAAAVEGNWGGILLAQGNLAEAEAHFEHALSEAKSLGAKGGESGAYATLAVVALMRGRLQIAREHAERSVEIRRATAEAHTLAESLGWLGAVLAAQGDLAGAREKYREALRIQEQGRETGGAARTRLALARLDVDEGRPAGAERSIRDALAVFQAEQMRDDELEARLALSRCLLAQGHTAKAREVVNEARRSSAQSQNAANRLLLAVGDAAVKAAESRQHKSAPPIERPNRSC